jgi:hypothetical protein
VLFWNCATNYKCSNEFLFFVRNGRQDKSVLRFFTSASKIDLRSNYVRNINNYWLETLHKTYYCLRICEIKSDNFNILYPGSKKGLVC